MYHNGQGVPQDYKEAMKWYRLAADQGDAWAQNALGLMYESGQGVPASRVVAYALYNISAAADSSSETGALANRTTLSESMSAKEVEAAQNLTREMAKPENLLKALIKYVKKPSVNRPPKAN